MLVKYFKKHMQNKCSTTEYANTPAGIYVHVPYCIRKCRYCDFVSFERAPQDEYFEKLAVDIRRAGAWFAENGFTGRQPENKESMSGAKLPVDTVFFGGGTPSLASRAQLKKVLDAIRESFDIAADPEITIEVNPETITAEKAAELKSLGFDRISMGVQSLDDNVLAAMGRIHSADRARQAFKALREAGFDNINLDLIFGAPMRQACNNGNPQDGGKSGDAGYKDVAQSFESWQRTLDEVIAMAPEHISFYSLQLEEGTPLFEAYRSGRVELPSWEDNRRMYHYAVEMLREKGYHHYEVSNAARPGFECRHNLKYWTMQPYLGFGTSAHSFTGLCRGEADWSRGVEVCSIFGLEPETLADLKGDFIFTQLRLTDGLDATLYKAVFSSEFSEDFGVGGKLQKLIKEGLLQATEKGFKLTPKGLDNTNPVMEELLAALP